MPLESRSVVSTESASRLRISGFITSRSTIDLDRVLALLVENDLLSQLLRLAVDANAREALLRDLLEELGVLAFAPAHERREQHDARTLGQLRDRIDDLLAAIAC